MCFPSVQVPRTVRTRCSPRKSILTMELRWLVLFESMCFVVFVLITLLLSTFNGEFFEVEMDLCLLTCFCFLQPFFLGLEYVLIINRMESKETARRVGHQTLIKFPIALFSVAIFGFFLAVIVRRRFDYGHIYREQLVQRYTNLQGQPDEYLDRLHQTQRCCGVLGMRTSESEPELFQPDNEMLLIHLPKSCCNRLSNHQNRCTYRHIYPDKCDTRHAERVTIFRTVIGTLLVVSLVEKILMHFVFAKFAGSLLSRFRCDCISVERMKREN